MTATFNYLLGVIGFSFILFSSEFPETFKTAAVIIGIIIIAYAFKRMMTYNKERIYDKQRNLEDETEKDSEH